MARGRGGVGVMTCSHEVGECGIGRVPCLVVYRNRQLDGRDLFAGQVDHNACFHIVVEPFAYQQPCHGVLGNDLDAVEPGREKVASVVHGDVQQPCALKCHVARSASLLCLCYFSWYRVDRAFYADQGYAWPEKEDQDRTHEHRQKRQHDPRSSSPAAAVSVWISLLDGQYGILLAGSYPLYKAAAADPDAHF